MLIGYVSDENYVAIADCAVELDQGGQTAAATHSTARGAIHADVPPGDYRVSLVKTGFGSKSVKLTLPLEKPYQFRLLSDCLLGYVWPKWARTGEQSEFRVHSVEPYQLSLWRYGLKKEFIRYLGVFDEHGPRAVMQITPDGDYTQTGIKWNQIGYTNPHQTQFVTGPEKPGLYYLHAKTATRFFSFPWVVAPDKPRADVAVVLATNNWCAYNNFGGRSNYVNSAGLPPTPTVNARLDLVRYDPSGAFGEWRLPDDAYLPLTFDRPELGCHVAEQDEVTDFIGGRLDSSTAPAEWRTLAWLEREGFAYDTYAEHHLHSGALDLDAYKVVIISAHPEYWSRQMFANLKSWVFERGGKFMYLGGNGLNCEIEFLDDDATMHFRTFLGSDRGAKGTLGYIDEEGNVFESRMHRTYESEATLTGLVTTETGIMTGAPYRVIEGGHWIFEGTGLAKGDVFGKESLHLRCHGGASGHETDKMSASSPPNTLLLAKGLNPEDGGADIVTFDTESGGEVFSVGSITWPSSVLVDPAISQITNNVLRRFLGHA